MVLARIVLGQPASLTQIAGAVLVCGGVLIVAKSQGSDYGKAPDCEIEPQVVTAETTHPILNLVAATTDGLAERGLVNVAVGWRGLSRTCGCLRVSSGAITVTDVNTNARATSFGVVAPEYDKWRPSYPVAAVDWLAPSAPARVADVGAGTGKLTELLLARGLDVDAVEPDPRMLRVLGRNNPPARPHHSDCEHIPVEDASLDAVLVADAWHWFEAEPTIMEIRRVLKPGGWLGLVWNVVAEPVEPWELSIADDSDEYDRQSKGTAAGLNRRLSYFDDDDP